MADEQDHIEHVEKSPQEKQADPKIVDTISIEDLKTAGAAGANALSQMFTNAVANQQRQTDNVTAASARMNDLANAATGAMLNRLATMDVSEATAIKKVEESGLARQVSELNAAIVAMAQNIAAIVKP